MGVINGNFKVTTVHHTLTTKSTKVRNLKYDGIYASYIFWFYYLILNGFEDIKRSSKVIDSSANQQLMFTSHQCSAATKPSDIL